MLLEILFLSLTASCSRISDKENLSLKKSCGVRTLGSSQPFKILGGEAIKPNEYPWMVKLKIDRNDMGQRAIAYCSGSLISSRHILTAAHCVMSVHKKKMSLNCMPRYKTAHVKPQNVSAYVGTKCAPPERCQRPHQISEIHVHKKFDYCSKNSQHDLAILELKNDVTNKEAAPICLPSADLALAKEVQIAGSGIGSESGQNMLKVATLKFVERGRDRRTIRGKSKTASGCLGDSGGPLFQLAKNGKYALVGVYSGPSVKTKNGCGILNEWNIYSDVRRHLKWICKLTGVCSLRK
ncbi:Trypsin [Trichostrongylus colubriformis]|uniref:Trypsin n=1 Tax=Trichostrongylus colubriformis TaxID=6319 RepID=A0AAN8EY73_TRICO